MWFVIVMSAALILPVLQIRMLLKRPIVPVEHAHSSVWLEELTNIVDPPPHEGWFLWEAKRYVESGAWWHWHGRYDGTPYAYPTPTKGDFLALREWAETRGK